MNEKSVTMSKQLKALILITDVLFLTYWSLSLLDLLGVFQLPPSMMYAEFDQPRVFAWNWSFFPVDVLFSITGIAAVRLANDGDPRWRPMAMISLCLTFVAGLMAIGYWTILGEFDPAWYLPNLALAVWPLFFLPGLLNDIVRPA
ncbi:MAG: DUF5360 family protein [Brevundimonas sp.]